MNNNNINNKEEEEIKYYKYRTLDNYKFLLEILLYNRLYASDFESMNDPMEGIYTFEDSKFVEEMMKLNLDLDDAMQKLYDIKNKIYGSKGNLKICSLCENPNNFLMWSHYANGHRGIAIEVKIKDKYEIKPITYVNSDDELKIAVNRFLEENPEELAKEILSKKLYFWQYEEEVRVFSETNDVEVEIQKIILGHKISKEDEEIIRELAEKRNITIEEQAKPTIIGERSLLQ